MSSTFHATLVLLVLSLLAAGCQRTVSGDSEADSATALRDTRERVIHELGVLVPALEQTLSASLRFSQGNHDGCEHTLETTTGFSYNINGRLDVFQGEANAEPAAQALEAAGWKVDEADSFRVVASKAGMTFSLSSLAESTGDQAFLFTGGDATCHVVGKERAAEFSTDREPLGAR